MNLDELLKVNSVRCARTKVDEDLVEGEIYKVEGFNDEAIKIVDRNGFSSWHNKNLFETVPNNDMSKSNTEIDISENSVNAVNNVIPTFKVGDKVYKFGDADVKTILEVFEDGYMSISNYPYRVNHEVICHATKENYEMLCKLYPHLEFELPHKRHSEWVSVNEQLPEPNKLVLVAIHRPQYYVPDFMYITTADYDEVRKKWSSINVVDDLHNVVYWQPFPKLPKL